MRQLNPQQQEAVNYIHGPLLVLAGAGSGKTSVITEKVAHLITNCGYKPHQIIALTFTNKAAKEMRERISKRLKGENSRGLQISTFHTLGLNILKKNHAELGYKKNFTLFDAQDSLTLIHDLAYQAYQATKQTAQAMQSQISLWKNALQSPQDLASYLNNEDPLYATWEIYQQYQRYLKAYNAIDFDDLIYIPVQLLKNNETVLTYWRHKFHYMLIDEYQDTNESQYQLMRLLVGMRQLFTVVGDDDQSIYAWRGARPENLQVLNEHYPQLKVIKLEQNYRSTGCILHAANTLIDNNTHLFVKKLWSQHSYGDPIRIITTKDENAEAQTIVSDIMTHKIQHNSHYRDYAVLVRGNHQTFLLERFLQTYKIPYAISGGTSFFAKAEIKDALAYCKLMINPDDDCALLRIINTPRREIGPTTLEGLGQYATQRHISLFQAIDEMGLGQFLKPNAIERLQRFRQLILEYQHKILQPLSNKERYQHLLSLMDAIDYRQWLIDNSSTLKQAEKRFENISDLCTWITRCDDDEEIDGKDFADTINRMLLLDIIDRDQTQKDDNKVQILTVHASKGLEYPYVYMMGVEEGLLPHQQSIDDDTVEEERRLAYVAITRAQKQLTMTHTRQRSRFGETIATKPSRFIDELPQQDIKWQGRNEQITHEEKQATTEKYIAMMRARFGNKQS